MILAPMTDTLPAALFTAAQVREIDARLIAAGTPGFELMQRAAHAAWRALRRRWPEAGVLTVLRVAVPAVLAAANGKPLGEQLVA